MRALNLFGMGIRSMLSIWIALLIGQRAGHGGEFTPVVKDVVENTLEITIDDLEFTGEGSVSVGGTNILLIPTGMEIDWVNRDSLTTINGDLGLMPHGIQISDESKEVFKASPILTREDDTFKHTFDKIGTFSYSCFIHPFMKGKIVVVDLPGAS